MQPIPFDVTFHPGWYHRACGVDFGRRFWEDPAYRVEADRAMRRALYDHFGPWGIGEKDPAPRPVLGSDLLAAGYLHSGILGCDIRYSASGSPEVICRHLSEEESMALTVPDLTASELWRNQEEQISWLLEHYGHVLPCMNLMGIQNIALDLRGEELFIDYLDQPEIAEHLLRAATDLSIAIGQRYRQLSPHISGGVTAVVSKTRPEVYLTSNCTVELVSGQIYEEFLLKYDNELAQAFPDFAIHHCGRSMEHVVNGYARVNNLRFAEVGAFSDLAAVRRTLPRVFLNARYSPVHLKEVSGPDLRAEISALREAGAPAELLSISCVGIDADTPDSQVQLFLDAVRS